MSPQATRPCAAAPRTARGGRAAALAGPRGGEEVEEPGDDDARRVLQGRARPLQLPHDRADAHHLRLLSALHEAAARRAGEGDRPEGAPVRQLERDRQGPRHRTRLARRHHRQGTGDRRTRVPRQPRRQAGSELPREARRQDVQPHAEGHHLRRAERRLQAPEHDDVQVDGRRRRAPRARVLLRRRRLHRVEGIHAAEEGAAEVSRTAR